MVEKDAPPGIVSFGLSIDDRQQLPLIGKTLDNALHSHCEIAVKKLFLDGKDVLWFDAVSPSLPNTIYDATDFWISAVYPSYLKQRYPDLKPNEDGTTREKYNARRYNADLLLKDIVGIKLGVESQEIPLLVEQLKALGFKVKTEGQTTTAQGPDVTFQLVALAQGPRTIEVQISLSRNKTGQQIYTFGEGSELRFYPNRTATWTFPGALRYDEMCTTEASRRSLTTSLASLCPH